MVLGPRGRHGVYVIILVDPANKKEQGNATIQSQRMEVGLVLLGMIKRRADPVLGVQVKRPLHFNQ